MKSKKKKYEKILSRIRSNQQEVEGVKVEERSDESTKLGKSSNNMYLLFHDTADKKKQM